MASSPFHKTLEQAYRALCEQGRCSDKGTTHSYLKVYEALLASYRDTAKSVLEVGVEHGWSMELWRNYFDPKCTVWGVDLNRPAEVPVGTNFVAGNATDPALLAYLDQNGYEVIIDDASHLSSDQATTFNLLRPLLIPGGMYVIEDLASDEAVAYVKDHTEVDWTVVDLRSVKHRYDDVLMVHMEPQS